MTEKLPIKINLTELSVKHLKMRILIKNNVLILNHVYKLDLHRSFKSYRISYDIISQHHHTISSDTNFFNIYIQTSYKYILKRF